MSVLLLAAAWIVLPAVLVWNGKDRWAIAVLVWWVIMFLVIAYLAFEYSARPRHPNEFVAVGSSFVFAGACGGALASLGSAGLIAIFWRRLRALANSSTPQGND